MVDSVPLEVRNVPRTSYVSVFPTRRVYARLVKSDYLSLSEYRRVSLEFDCIDADSMTDVGDEVKKLLGEEDYYHFSLLRIVTTERHFEDVVGETPDVGRWFFFEIGEERIGAQLMSWHAQLGPEGYYEQSKGYTIGGQSLQDPDDPDFSPAPRSLGAAAVRKLLPKSISELSRLVSVTSNTMDIERFLNSVEQPVSCLVRDVGQANFVSLLDQNNNAYFHVDVGLPVSWNGHTAPKTLSVSSRSDQVVLLTHFDWDHIHAPYTVPSLFAANWIVPAQKIGPGAARLMLKVAKSGSILVWPTGYVYRGPHLTIGDCVGVSTSLNDTGLAAVFELKTGFTVLLCGDADYRALRPDLTLHVDHLVVSHHGAAIVGAVPISPCLAGGTAVVSYGSQNVYGHPHHTSEPAHYHAGWGPWIPTAATSFNARGGRLLT